MIENAKNSTIGIFCANANASASESKSYRMPIPHFVFLFCGRILFPILSRVYIEKDAVSVIRLFKIIYVDILALYRYERAHVPLHQRIYK